MFELSYLSVTTLLTISCAVLATYLSFQKCKNHQFYSDTFALIPLGIFVWGDGLVLGPFWIISGFLWKVMQLSPLWMIRYYLLFWIIRSAYEVIYWILHQSSSSEYSPPLGRNIKWLKQNEQRILYQVMHTGVVIITLFLLIYSFA